MIVKKYYQSQTKMEKISEYKKEIAIAAGVVTVAAVGYYLYTKSSS